MKTFSDVRLVEVVFKTHYFNIILNIIPNIACGLENMIPTLQLKLKIKHECSTRDTIIYYWDNNDITNWHNMARMPSLFVTYMHKYDFLNLYIESSMPNGNSNCWKHEKCGNLTNKHETKYSIIRFT